MQNTLHTFKFTEVKNAIQKFNSLLLMETNRGVHSMLPTLKNELTVVKKFFDF